MIQPLLVFGNWTIFVLRVVLGLILMRHGLPKLKDLKGTGSWFDSIGFRPGGFWALAAGVVEFVGGIAIILGFLTQAIALLVALQFIVILFGFKKSKMFGKESEIDWLILTIALALAALGGGVLSLDSYLGFILY